MITRRQFLRGTAATAIGTGLYAWQIEPRWVQHVYRNLTMPNLPDELVGRTLVQISDMHIGAPIDWRYQFKQFAEIRAMNPDFVVYTGDFVSYDSPEQFTQLQAVAPELPHGQMGTAAILGNHDYGHNWSQLGVADNITTILDDHNIPVLRDQSLTVNGLQFVGFSDMWSPEFHKFWSSEDDPKTVLETFDLTQPTIALAHNPDLADKPIWNGYTGWILSGHTHGGQVRPPFLPPPILPIKNREYERGLVALDDGRTLYVNRGLGHIQQVRFCVRPEITIFTLTKS